jgi:hypothetical protein
MAGAGMALSRDFSADAHGGWKNHYRRMLRWKKRSIMALSNLPISDFDDAHDLALAYFVWCHSLRDWLTNDNAIEKDSLNRELSGYPIWQLTRDVANRTRHFEMNQHPRDSEWSTYRAYDPFSIQIEGRERHVALLMFDGRRWEIKDAIVQSADMWAVILASHNLL